MFWHFYMSLFQQKGPSARKVSWRKPEGGDDFFFLYFWTGSTSPFSFVSICLMPRFSQCNFKPMKAEAKRMKYMWSDLLNNICILSNPQIIKENRLHIIKEKLKLWRDSNQKLCLSVTIKHRRTELSGNLSLEVQEWKLARKRIPKGAGVSEQCLWRGTQNLLSLGVCTLTFNMHEHLGA